MSAGSGSCGLPTQLAFVVVGASGDLAARKIYPALFSLYCRGLLPADFHVAGFARTSLDNDSFRERIAANLTCRYTPEHDCAAKTKAFLDRCIYVPGEYGSSDSFLDLYSQLRDAGAGGASLLFYLAIPPSVVLDVSRAMAAAGLVHCGRREEPWTRVVVEKPFGRDRESSDELAARIAKVFAEEHTYRIDHYLGKEMIQNLLALRFANVIFEPLWNRRYVRSVQISWKEDLDVRGRAGYFDGIGIIRDVMQNHLLQMLALVAMEPPAGLDAHSIRDEKVRVLRAVPPVLLSDAVLGQYSAGDLRGVAVPGYAGDPSVKPGSRTPTYAAALLKVDNERWHGVPFLLCAGKGLDARMTEIRIQFLPAAGGLFRSAEGCPETNELVIRVQPDEAVYFRIMNKAPGPGMKLVARSLDLKYSSAFEETIPEAYENLLLDAIRGDRSLFIRSDELAAAWDIFTPALREIDEQAIEPEYYAFGSPGPHSADELAARLGLTWGATAPWCPLDVPGSAEGLRCK